MGALHYCFRNKRELILLVADRAAATISSAFEDVDPSRGVEQTIRDCVDCFWTWMRDNPGLQLACMELLMQAIRELESDDDDLYERVTYRTRVPKVSPTYRSHDVHHEPGQHTSAQ